MTTKATELAKTALATAAENTAIEKHNEAADSIETMFKKIMPKLAQASLANIPPEFVVSTAMTVLRGSDDLKACDPLSVVHCVVQSAQTGLRLDPVLQQAALVPRWNSRTRRKEAQFQPMYKGLLVLARRSKQIAHVASQPVYDCDEFSYGYGDQQFLRHIPSLKRPKDATITHYYSYSKLMGGGFQFEVMTQEEIDEVREFALKDKQNIKASPWTTDPIPMALKTVLRRLLKLLPVEDAMLSAAIQADELLERGIPQEHVIEGGLVVPGASYQDDAPSPETVPTKPVKPEPKKEESEPEDKPTQTFMQLARAALEAVGKKGDRDKAQSWGVEARKQLTAKNITQAEFDELGAIFQKYFPPAPKPQPTLFDESGTKREEPKPEKPAAKKPEVKKPEKKVPAKSKAVKTAFAEFAEKIENTPKLGPLFSLKGAIEKNNDLSESERATLLSSLVKKFDTLKRAATA